MNTTPLWVPLLVAGLGLFGTAVAGLGGVWLTQRRADKREAVSWNRQLERERAQWAREDAARTFEQRRGAYEQIYTSLRALGVKVNGFAGGEAGGEELGSLPEFHAAIDASDAVSIYGSTPIVKLTNDAVAACVIYAIKATWRGEGESTLAFPRLVQTPVKVGEEHTETARQQYEESLKRLRNAIRDELGVPIGGIPQPEP